jgi:steroid delta-isomerase
MNLHCPDTMAAVADLFMEMSPGKLERLGDIYSPGIAFYDPIHEIRGLAQLRVVLSKWFRKMPKISFKVLDAHADDRTGFFLWTMTYPQNGIERVIHGMSHFRFAPDGRICEQRDQWDASFVLYGEHPVLGWLMQKIKRRAQFITEADGA